MRTTDGCNICARGIQTTRVGDVFMEWFVFHAIVCVCVWCTQYSVCSVCVFMFVGIIFTHPDLAQIHRRNVFVCVRAANKRFCMDVCVCLSGADMTRTHMVHSMHDTCEMVHRVGRRQATTCSPTTARHINSSKLTFRSPRLIT